MRVLRLARHPPSIASQSRRSCGPDGILTSKRRPEGGIFPRELLHAGVLYEESVLVVLHFPQVAAGEKISAPRGLHMRGCITSNNTSGRTLAPMMGGGAAEEVRYTAFLLDEDSRLALLGWASEVDSSLALPPDWTTRADHLTIWHRPTPERMAGYDLCGFRCELRVLGLAKDHRALAVHVEVPDFVPTPDAEVRAPRPFVPRETKTIELTRPDGPRAHPLSLIHI